MPTDKLTDTTVRKATPAERRQKLADGGGLYLEIDPSGGKWWRLKYRFEGKEKLLSMGTYPETTLKDARVRRDAARKLLAAGVDPSAARKAEKSGRALAATNSFEAIAREFHATKRGAWSDTHAAQWLRCCEKDLFPWIGNEPIADITAAVLLETLRRVEARGTIRMAHDLREYAGQVFRYGAQTSRCAGNPASDLKGALQPYNERHYGAVLEPLKLGQLLRDVEGYAGQPVTRAALGLSVLLFQRPGNIRAMEWVEVDLEGAMWTIPSAKMKRTKQEKISGRPHLVPLATQALHILRELKPLTEHSPYVFPALTSSKQCMSENTVRVALRRLGYSNEDMTAHGFRATARTLLIERVAGVLPDVIEAQLAHGKSGPLGMAYDRAEYVEQRRRLMQTWADYLDKLRAGAEVLEFKAA